jgi:ABC-type multidrug transport system fused ATPase/permease subunit
VFKEAGQVAKESITGIRTVVSTSAQSIMAERFAARVYDIFLGKKKEAYYTGLSFALSNMILFLIYAFAFWFGSWLQNRGTIDDPKDIMKAFFAVVMSFMGIGQVMQLSPDMNKARKSAASAIATLNIFPSIDAYSEQGLKPEISTKQDDIVFKDVVFRYASREEVTVLDQVNFTCEAGKTTALVGPSGCGKSSLISLLMRFYEFEAGSIKIGEGSIRDMNVAHLRSQIALVDQSTSLFEGTIAENIRYGCKDEVVSDAQVEQAASKANMEEFLKTMPDGLNTQIGSRGTQLSGGQRQRVAIARALLVKKKKILLLDEATASLDNQSERLVQHALDTMMQDKEQTVIVIAHRLATIRNADKIVVFDEGKVVQTGSHDELVVQKDGLYYQLASLQNLTN